MNSKSINLSNKRITKYYEKLDEEIVQKVGPNASLAINDDERLRRIWSDCIVASGLKCRLVRADSATALEHDHKHYRCFQTRADNVAQSRGEELYERLYDMDEDQDDLLIGWLYQDYVGYSVGNGRLWAQKKAERLNKLGIKHEKGLWALLITGERFNGPPLSDLDIIQTALQIGGWSNQERGDAVGKESEDDVSFRMQTSWITALLDDTKKNGWDINQKMSWGHKELRKEDKYDSDTSQTKAARTRILKKAFDDNIAQAHVDEEDRATIWDRHFPDVPWEDLADAQIIKKGWWFAGHKWAATDDQTMKLSVLPKLIRQYNKADAPLEANLLLSYGGKGRSISSLEKLQEQRKSILEQIKGWNVRGEDAISDMIEHLPIVKRVVFRTQLIGASEEAYEWNNHKNVWRKIEG